MSVSAQPHLRQAIPPVFAVRRSTTVAVGVAALHALGLVKSVVVVFARQAVKTTRGITQGASPIEIALQTSKAQFGIGGSEVPQCEVLAAIKAAHSTIQEVPSTIDQSAAMTHPLLAFAS
jgi:hypothetical protein